MKRRNVDRFLLNLYIGAGGMLPQKLLAGVLSSICPASDTGTDFFLDTVNQVK